MEAQPDSERVPGVPEALGRLRVALDQSYARASRRLGLSAQQAELLCAALRPAAIGEIAGALHCDRSNVSRLADRTSDRGLLRRQESSVDRRQTLIELTPEGRALAEELIHTLSSRVAPLVDSWPPERRAAAVEILSAIAAQLERA